MRLGPTGCGLRGAVRHVRTFGATQRADIALQTADGETLIEVDTPRNRELRDGEIVELAPVRFRIFSA
jgi:sulfate transport system ATP-binding protein